MKQTKQNYIGFENSVREISRRLVEEQMAYLKEVVKKYGNGIKFTDTPYNDVFVKFYNIDASEWQVGQVNSIIMDKTNRLYVGTTKGYAVSLFFWHDLSTDEWEALCDAVHAIDEEICDEEED